MLVSLLSLTGVASANKPLFTLVGEKWGYSFIGEVEAFEAGKLRLR